MMRQFPSIMYWNRITPLVPTQWKETKISFMIGLTRMMSGTDTITLQQKRMNQGAHTLVWVTTTSLKNLQMITTSLQSQKSSTIGPRRQDLLVKHLHL